MESETISKAKRTASNVANISFYGGLIMVFLAFIGGTMFGNAAHQMFITMFSPDVVVLPNTNK